MLSRLDAHVRYLLVLAQAIGFSETAGALGTEHMVAALLDDGLPSAEPSTATRVLTGLGVSRAAASVMGQALRGHRPIRPLTIEEATALRVRGIDLDALPVLSPSVEAAPHRPWPARLWRKEAPSSVPQRVEGNLGFSAEAKNALEGMLREGLLLGDDYLGSEHLLLGLLGSDDPGGTTALRLCGIDLNRARALTAAMPRTPMQGPVAATRLAVSGSAVTVVP